MEHATMSELVQEKPFDASAGETTDWCKALSLDRPIYDCPHCKQAAMQFYAQLPGEPDLKESFHCHACGSTWQV
jgi:hypothetical protein